tara:strand:+ start:1656 stop:2909 length:1254 start_codon:yes stop_codon:yes gene_type:complete
MRLINIGVEGTAGQLGYNKLVGTYGTLKNILLLDDNEVLDSLNDANRFLAFKQYNSPNQKNMDVNQSTCKNALGTAWLGHEAGAIGAGPKLAEWAVNPSSTGTIGASALILPADNNRGQSKGWLDLKEALPLLKSLDSLDTRVFTNLKLVVEYSADLDDYMEATTDTNTATFEAQLIVDEIIDENERKAMAWPGSVSYVSIEHDLVQVPALVGGVDVTPTNETPVQAKQFKVNGFLNKSLGRMLICKAPTLLANYKTGTSNSFAGKWASTTQNKEILNCRVNGVTKLPGQGIDREAQRLAMLHDSWGQCSSYFCSSGAGYKALDAAQNRNTLVKGGNTDIGILDYYGLFINDKVLDLQVDFQRSGCYVYSTNAVVVGTDNTNTSASVHNQAIDLHVFAEVYKSIVSAKDGTYSVNYL